MMLFLLSLLNLVAFRMHCRKLDQCDKLDGRLLALLSPSEVDCSWQNWFLTTVNSVEFLTSSLKAAAGLTVVPLRDGGHVCIADGHFGVEPFELPLLTTVDCC